METWLEDLDMLGEKTTLNVGVAFGIAAYLLQNRR